jgi:hypothetical protein
MSFLPLSNKKSNEIDSPALGRGQGKHMKYVSFSWPALEAALSVFNVHLSVKNNFLRRNY